MEASSMQDVENSSSVLFYILQKCTGNKSKQKRSGEEKAAQEFFLGLQYENLRTSRKSSEQKKKLPGQVLLATDDNGDMVLAVDDLDLGAGDLGLDRVAALHGEELVVAAVVDGDIAGELVPDHLEAPVDLAGAAADDVVEGVPRRDVGVAEEAVHEVGPYPARRIPRRMVG